jgi:hypothetical protein
MSKIILTTLFFGSKFSPFFEKETQIKAKNESAQQHQQRMFWNKKSTFTRFLP